MSWPWSRPRIAPDERRELENQLKSTRLLIAQAYAGFNAVADPELVESYIYEIQALRSRYSYLIRRRKALEGPEPTREPLPREGETSPQALPQAFPVLPVA